MIFVVEIALCALIEVSGVALSLGIVWYERNALPDTKRTLINRLISFQFLLAALANVTTSNTVLLSKAFGGIGAAYCDGLVLFTKGGFACYFLTADAVVILRYLFTCRLSNVLALNDELLYTAITTVAASFSVYLSSLLWFTGSRFSQMHFFCTGIYPDDRVRVGYPSMAIVMSTVALHIALALKIFWHQRRVEAQVTPQGAPGLEVNMTKASLITLRTSVGIFLFFLLGRLAVNHATKVANRLTGDHLGDTWQFMYGTCMLSVFIPGVYYTKNRDMSGKVWKMYRDSLSLKT